MYNNPYIPTYNSQNVRERIDNQIAQLQQMKDQINNTPVAQPTNLTQNFQIASNNNSIRYANSVDEVQKEYISADTPFFSKDLSVLWIKSVNNEIRTFELNEIIPKDSKDLQIEYLQAQIEELKKGMIKDESNTDVNESTTDTVESKESTDIPTVRRTKKK